MMKVKIDENGWIKCRKCGHKLARITEKGRKAFDVIPLVEFKCHSCKNLCLWEVDTMETDKELRAYGWSEKEICGDE